MIRYSWKSVIKDLFRTIKHKPQCEHANVGHGGKEFEVRNDIISQFIISRVIPIVGMHPYPLGELSLMVSAICWVNPTHIFEWGTNIGKSARIFYETVKRFKMDTVVHSIDLPDNVNHVEHPHSKRGYYVKGIKAVKLYHGDGVTTGINLYKSFGKEIRSFFFLDGDHEYESVKRELQLIHDSVLSPAILVHDTFFQAEESGYNVGPFMAIQDFLKRVPHKYSVIETNLGLPGMTFLYQNNS